MLVGKWWKCFFLETVTMWFFKMWFYFQADPGIWGHLLKLKCDSERNFLVINERNVPWTILRQQSGSIGSHSWKILAWLDPGASWYGGTFVLHPLPGLFSICKLHCKQAVLKLWQVKPPGPRVRECVHPSGHNESQGTGLSGPHWSGCPFP